MGHTRLGTVPKTQKWLEIVSTIAGDTAGGTSGAAVLVTEVKEIADKTLEVAGAGLEKPLMTWDLATYSTYLLK